MHEEVNGCTRRAHRAQKKGMRENSGYGNVASRRVPRHVSVPSAYAYSFRAAAMPFRHWRSIRAATWAIAAGEPTAWRKVVS